MSQQLPSALLSSLQTAKGFDEAAFVRTHASGEQIVSIRLNPAKCEPAQLELAVGDKVPWSSNGYYLPARPSFTLDPMFHAGAYYVQEASSMFIEEAVRQCCAVSEPLKALDLCAAPGGKSTLLQSVLSAESLLVSNEVIKTRAAILAENITKWGAPNVVVTNNDPKDFQRLPGFFDLIVVDAPCSGSGLFRKDPSAMEEWSLNNVELCSQRQQRILADVLPSLKDGGVLIYSTCSYSEKEDEEIADWLLSEEGLQMENIRLQIKPDWNIVESSSKNKTAYGYRFYPDKVKGEGFFIAVFRKLGAAVTQKQSAGKSKPLLPTKQEVAVVQKYVSDDEMFSLLKLKDEVIVFPSVQFENMLLLQSLLYLKKAGIKAGTVIRDELVPDHELVMSTIMSGTIRRVEVDKETVLDYLRRKDVHIEAEKKGWAIITYHGLNIGLAKILPNRVNNYYPREWRIINK
ncbi:RNA methyltransferase [Ferruginibacter sp. HRS2-29]|uniref:methyltransferase RsmF C-terminal domain-like protein n=1 Tax=Ferruginibacter sp. HRS2-29 TaxID=2487334 RepID=UPI0020CE9AC4|nr:RNA methyltransferase [Ferruginibacter sp. HRS2-29]MCP9753230.1 RNA methyltransferase [Ferruginibacter sp. HRS2-29]